MITCAACILSINAPKRASARASPLRSHDCGGSEICCSLRRTRASVCAFRRRQYCRRHEVRGRQAKITGRGSKGRGAGSPAISQLDRTRYGVVAWDQGGAADPQLQSVLARAVALSPSDAWAHKRYADYFFDQHKCPTLCANWSTVSASTP